MKAKAQGGGLYRTDDNTFWERPWIDRRRTWRKVDAPNLKRAREILSARRTDSARAAAGLGRDPYGPGPVTVGALMDLWLSADCPNRRFHGRAGKQLRDEQLRVAKLRLWWGSKTAEKLVTADVLAYWEARRKTIARGHGGRAVDLEITTLRNVLHWSTAHGRLSFPPLSVGVPRFRSQQVRHCRECMPGDAGELHAIARYLFEDPERAVLGWQVLVTAMTGCRTSEVMRLRWDAAPRGPGHIEGDWLWLERSKHGINPYALIHPALGACIRALRLWRDEHHADCPWWFPSPKLDGLSISPDWLKHVLPQVSAVVTQRHVTPHGLRAFFVTVRRSQGASDAQIAAEIGDVTGAAIIASTYGQVPPNWRGKGVAAMTWLPGKLDGQRVPPAWDALELPANVVPLRAAGIKVD